MQKNQFSRRSANVKKDWERKKKSWKGQQWKVWFYFSWTKNWACLSSSFLAITNKVSQFLRKLLSSTLSLLLQPCWCTYVRSSSKPALELARKKVCILFWQKCTFNNDVHTQVSFATPLMLKLAFERKREEPFLFFINSIKVSPLVFKGIWNLIPLGTYVHFMDQKNHLLWSANNTNWYESKASTILLLPSSETQ